MQVAVGPKPKISVVIAVKNEETFIDTCIDSIISQQEVDVELILVDDGSTDSTREKIRSHCEKNAKVRLVNASAPGKVAAFNEGMDSATGEFFCLFAGDDRMVPLGLRRRVEPLLASPSSQPALSACKVRLISQDPGLNGHLYPRASGTGGSIGICFMFNEALRSLVFPIPSDLPNEDTWLGLWARYCRQVAVLHVPFAACEYRIHAGNTMLTADRFERFNRQIHERHQAFSHFLDRHPECLEETGKREMMALIGAEQSRVQGQVLRTVTAPGLGWRDRLKFASLSNPSLLQLRTRVLRWLSSPAHIPALSLAVRLPYKRV